MNYREFKSNNLNQKVKKMYSKSLNNVLINDFDRSHCLR